MNRHDGVWALVGIIGASWSLGALAASPTKPASKVKSVIPTNIRQQLMGLGCPDAVDTVLIPCAKNAMKGRCSGFPGGLAQYSACTKTQLIKDAKTAATACVTTTSGQEVWRMLAALQTAQGKFQAAKAACVAEAKPAKPAAGKPGGSGSRNPGAATEATCRAKSKAANAALQAFKAGVAKAEKEMLDIVDTAWKCVVSNDGPVPSVLQKDWPLWTGLCPAAAKFIETPRKGCKDDVRGASAKLDKVLSDIQACSKSAQARASKDLGKKRRYIEANKDKFKSCAKWAKRMEKDRDKSFFDAAGSLTQYAVEDALEFIGKYGDKVVAWLKRRLESAKQDGLRFLKQKAQDLLNTILDRVEAEVPGARDIFTKLRQGDFVGAACDAFRAIAGKGSDRLIGWITDQAMKRLVSPIINKAEAWLVKKALGFAKGPVTSVVKTAVQPLVMLAINAVAPGIGAIATPVVNQLLNYALGKLYDWVVDQIKGKVATYVRAPIASAISGLVRRVVTPLKDRIVGALTQRCPEPEAQPQQTEESPAE